MAMKSKAEPGWVWWYTPLITGLGRQKQEDHELQDSLKYMHITSQGKEIKCREKNEHKQNKTKGNKYNKNKANNHAVIYPMKCKNV